MALLAAVQAGITIGGAIAGAVDPKDKERFGRIDEAFRRAVAGDKAALEWLKYRTGQFGTAASIPGAPFDSSGPVGGYGSAESRAYAQLNYNRAIAQLNLMGQVETIGEKVAPVIKETAREAGYEILPRWAIWAGVALALGAVIYLSSKKG